MDSMSDKVSLEALKEEIRMMTMRSEPKEINLEKPSALSQRKSFLERRIRIATAYVNRLDRLSSEFYRAKIRAMCHQWAGVADPYEILEAAQCELTQLSNDLEM